MEENPRAGRAGEYSRAARTAALLSAAGLALLVSGCGRTRTVQAQTTANVPGALPGVHLVSPLPNGDWTMPAGDFANTRFSPLAQINTGNVSHLKVTSTFSDGISHGHEGSPLVLNNTMYMVTPYPNNLVAIDLKNPDGPVKWIYRPNPDPRAQGIACCDVVNRGASYANGKIVYNLLDDHTVAVDAETGKELWRTQVGDIKYGETLTMAPLIVKNHVYVGNAGGELGVRGKLVSLDLNTGKIQWTAYSTGPDKDVLIGPNFKPFYKKDQGQNLGVSTWPPDQWKMGGGTIWGWVSYDPETNLIFYGTGNPGVWNADQRPGNNEFSCAIFARDADTGEAKWVYQIGPHDEWDYDEIMENIAVDMDWGGRMRKLLIHPARAGFMFVLDRETGEVLSAPKFVPSTNWAFGYNLKTGEPDQNPAKQTHLNKVVRDICPSSTGGKEFVPSSFSPRTGYLYIPGHDTCMDFENMQAGYIAGTPYLGADVHMKPGPTGKQGYFVAWDLKNQKPAWTLTDSALPIYSGVLATAGDVVFYGTMDGWFKAIDAHSGKLLWQYKTPSGIVGNPMTFVGPDGKQYVAIYSGIGGWMGATALPTVSTDDPYATLGATGAMRKIKELTQPGDMLYVFSF
jgi:PQQ-dependent dehydrogenase (methanol/ethanol family)